MGGGGCGEGRVAYWRPIVCRLFLSSFGNIGLYTTLTSNISECDVKMNIGGQSLSVADSARDIFLASHDLIPPFR